MQIGQKCSICGTVASVPKWHEAYDKVVMGQVQGNRFICAACGDRIRGEAVERARQVRR